MEPIEITTLKDILDKVPEENLKGFLKDLEEWYKFTKKIESLSKVCSLGELKDKNPDSMLRVNDGKNKTYYTIELDN